MDLRELRYFVAVYEERNLTAAARRCFISQPSVSLALGTIESELGTCLFVRHKKGVTPTSAAEILFPLAKRLLADAGAVHSLFKAEAPVERFTLGLLRSLDIARTTKFLASVATMPGLRLELVGSDDPADARIIEKGMVTDTETFVPLWRERFVLALPARHPLAIGTPIEDAELRGLAFIARCHCEAAATIKERGLNLRTVAVADSEEWALALVAAGIGATILPEGSVGARNDVIIRPLASHNVTREVGIAYGSRGAISPRGWEMISVLTGSSLRKSRRSVARLSGKRASN